MYANRNFLGKVGIVSPIAIVLGIVLGLEWIYVDQFLGYYWQYYPFLVICVSIPFYINSFLIFAHLFACAVVDPGGVSKDWSQANLSRVKFRSQHEKEEFIRDHPGEDLETIYSKDKLNTSEQIYSYCHICKIVKPERTHHCSLCNRCIVKMDHHCPWVGNCVGFANHKFFFLFCLHASLGCLTLGILLIPRFIQTFSLDTMISGNGVLMIAIGCICGIFVGAAIGFLGVLHGYHIIQNLTTIEMHFTNKKKNPFNMSNKWDNWRMVFGNDSWTWFLPIPPQYMPVDPHNFPKRQEMVMQDYEILIHSLSDKDKDNSL